MGQNRSPNWQPTTHPKYRPRYCHPLRATADRLCRQRHGRQPIAPHRRRILRSHHQTPPPLARLSKFDSTDESSSSNEDLETTIRQVIDQALVSEQVIDVFDAAGIKKPDISILSDEFLAELKGFEHKNIALEVLKKLLNDELKVRAKKNLVQSKTLMEMLENAIKKYQNKIITAAEVMEKLIHISKEIVASDVEAENMGLSEYEYAF